MALIKIPYSYRQFDNCKLATFVDKYTHHPTVKQFLGMILGTAVMLIGGLIYNIDREGLCGKIGYAFMFLGLILFFLGGWLIRVMSDKFDWAGKIAKRQEKKEKLNQMKPKKPIKKIIFLVVLCIVVVAAIVIGILALPDHLFHVKFKNNAGKIGQAEDCNKLVCLIIDKDKNEKYSKRFIPSEYLANSAEETAIV